MLNTTEKELTKTTQPIHESEMKSTRESSGPARRRLARLTLRPLLVVGTVVQAADPVTTSRFYTIAGTAAFACTPPNPVIPPTPIEPVTLSGMIHVVTRVTFVSPATETVLIHANLANVSGTGALSGLSYHAVGSAKQFNMVPPDPITPIVIPFSGTYDFIQQGPCHPSNITVRGAVQINPDGTQGPATAFTFSPPTT